ncbi:hypothetical protein GCM10028803_11830 [Larkinella knui]
MAHTLRQNSRLIGPGFFPGLVYDLGTYPGAVYDPSSGSHVHGEIYSVPETLLPTLDEYEGDEYVRTIVPVETATGFIDCLVYLFNQPTDSFPPIASGRYFD